MEIAVILDVQLFQHRQQGRQELLQEILVFRAVRGDIPAEYSLLLAVHLSHDLGSCAGAPLGKQMAHFKIADAVLVAQRDPALQLFKAKTVAVAVLFHLHQLHGGAVGADGGIQRGCKQGRQDHIHAGAGRRGHKPLDQLPVLLALHLHAEILGDAVAMEPLCKAQVAGGDHRRLYIQHHLGLGYDAMFLTLDG